MRSINISCLVSITVAVSAAVAPVRARADDLPVGASLAVAAQDEAVLVRPRPDYDAVGIAAGSFRLFPTITGTANFDTNVYDSDRNDKSDFSFLISPKLEARSGWAENSLDLEAGGTFQRYAKLTSDDNNQYNVSEAGRLEVANGVALSLDSSYARRTEPRGTYGDVLIGGEPSRYNDAMLKPGIALQFTNVQVSASGNLERYRYLPISTGGQSFSQLYRDRVEKDGSLRVDYAVGPGLRIFGNGTYNNQSYRARINGVNQDSHGYNVLAGVDFGLTHLLSGEIGLGYLSQKYAQPGFGTVGGFDYSAKLIWNPTSLLTVTGNAGKTLQQSPLQDQRGILESSFGLQIDYELLRNLIISVQGSAVFDRYKGFDRRDRLYVANLSARYLFNRNVETALTFNDRHQDTSSIFGRKYSGRSVAISLTFKR